MFNAIWDLYNISVSLARLSVNLSGIHLYDTPVTPMMKLWVDEASKVFGGLDILSLDVLHDSTVTSTTNLTIAESVSLSTLRSIF